MAIFDQEQLRPPGARTRVPAGLARRLALALVALAAAATVLSLAGPSNAQDGTNPQVDPDCLPPEEVPPELAPERDGKCPSDEAKAETAPPGPARPTTGPAKPTGPAPAPAGEGSGPAEPPSSPAPAVAGPPPKAAGEGGREGSSQPVGGRRPSSGRPGARRREARARGRGHRGRRTRGDRRATRQRARRRHRGNARAQLRAGARTLGPIPGWARDLLSKPLPDPLPAGKRLDQDFARMLRDAAERHDVGWPLVLAMLRARGRQGSAPASAAEVGALAREFSRRGAARNPRRAVAALSGASAFGSDLLSGIGTRTSFGDRVLALAAYHRAVSLRGLVRGLDAVKAKLVERVLASGKLTVYPGGLADVKAGRIDVRVMVLLLYLADRHGSVTVSSLQTGHSFLTKSGNVSNHSLGRAVDIAALGGVPIMGHQEPGSVTEHGLRNTLLLPRELWPSELISLWELGGPSFAMADHADHIHAGF